ncbi:MAG TPA: hypothetical protein VF877_11150 [Gaiellaceae bacterium]
MRPGIGGIARGETAELVEQQQDRRTAATQERPRHLLTLTGEERALDIGAGAFAIAIAPLAREVIGVDIVPELASIRSALVQAPRPVTSETAPPTISSPAAPGAAAAMKAGPSARNR